MLFSPTLTELCTVIKKYYPKRTGAEGVPYDGTFS